MRYMFHVIFLIIIACLQGTVCKALSVAGVSANLFIIYISIICFLAYKNEGIIAAGSYGLVLDILTARFIGVYTVLFIIAAFFILNLAEKVFKEPKFYICAITLFFVSVFINTFYYLIVFFVLHSIDISYAFFNIIVPEGIYDALLSIPLYFLIRRITEKFYSDKGEFIG